MGKKRIEKEFKTCDCETECTCELNKKGEPKNGPCKCYDSECSCKGVTLHAQSIPGRKSLKYLQRLIKIQSQIAGGLELGSKSGGSTFDFGGLDLGKLMQSLSESLSDEKLFVLITEIFKESNASIINIAGENIAISTDSGFDEVFDGEISLLLEVFCYIIEQNWGNVFKKKVFLNIKKMFVKTKT